MAGLGTKVILFCLLMNTMLVLIDPSFQAVKLPETFENMTADPGSITPTATDYISLFITVPSFVIDVMVAPLYLTIAEGLPIHVKMLVGIPLATMYLLALFSFFRGRAL